MEFVRGKRGSYCNVFIYCLLRLVRCLNPFKYSAAAFVSLTELPRTHLSKRQSNTVYMPNHMHTSIASIKNTQQEY